MNYSIGEAAEKMGTTTSALRYYDKVASFVDRDAAGRRKFKDNDFNFLEVINCLKRVAYLSKTSGTSLVYVCKDGTLQERYDYLDQEEGALEDKVHEMQSQLDF